MTGEAVTICGVPRHLGTARTQKGDFDGAILEYRQVLRLDKGADVNAKGNDGVTALFLASQNGHREVVQALLAKGADVNAKRSDGATALIVAKDTKVRALLVQAGAKPRLQLPLTAAYGRPTALNPITERCPTA